MEFKKICVVGTGLIGASLILSFKRKGIGTLIRGVDRADVLEKALSSGLVDEAFEPAEAAQVFKDSDLILLAVTIEQILEYLPLVAECAAPGTVVTDVGSTKARIVALSRQLFGNGRHFIGGHPMAGSEKSGIDAADPYLFENCFYILTPLPDTPNQVVETLASTLQLIGSKVLIMDEETHDRIAAAVSHLPQILAVCLVNFVEKYNREQPNYLKLAAGGFRDMTRIASSPFDLWQDICKTNSQNIIEHLDDLIHELVEFKEYFYGDELRHQFERAARTRLSIPKDTKGFLNPNYDISLVVEDKPGIIAAIATALASENINIRDIEVLKVRLLEGGTLRLSFETEQQRTQAVKLLSDKGFLARKI